MFNANAALITIEGINVKETPTKEILYIIEFLRTCSDTFMYRYEKNVLTGYTHIKEDEIVHQIGSCVVRFNVEPGDISNDVLADLIEACLHRAYFLIGIIESRQSQ